jgi:hypothetical protein
MFLIHRDFTRVVAAFTLLAAGAGFSGLAQAQSVDQTLDKIDVSGSQTVLGVKQNPTPLPPPFITVQYALGDAGYLSTANFKTCQGTGTRGLYCLDNNTVTRWPDADDLGAPVNRETLFNCDSGIGLQDCTAMTVDLAGNITVAGKSAIQTTTPPTYSIVRLVPKAPLTSCRQNWTAIPGINPVYCFRELVANRQLISDLQAIDGEAGVNFRFGAGFLTLEGTDVGTGQPFFHPNVQGGTPVELGRWNTATGEKLAGVTLVQFRTVSPARNFIVSSTTTGRVFAGEIPRTGTNIRGTATNLVLTPATACTPTATPVYETRASVRTRTTYFTRGCSVAGYTPILGNSLTFNTTPVLTQTTSFLATGVSVSPGIEVDLVGDGCFNGTVNSPNYPADGCDLLRNGDAPTVNTFPAAKFSGLKLADGSPSDWVMFQVRNLPDCRYLPVPRPAICAGAVLDAFGNAVPLTERGDPTTQYLNIVPLLPPEVTQATVLPEEGMLIGPKFRARAQLSNRSAPYRFDALFGIPEDGVTYKDTFQFTADIADLLGIPQTEKLGCGANGPLTRTDQPPPWDVIVNVSEMVPTVGGPKGVSFPPNLPAQLNATEFAGWLQNGDYCFNPSGTISVRGSAFIYGLEVAPSKPGTNSNSWYWPDSTFALLMRSLAKDLNDHLYTYACQALDGQLGGAPVSAANCDQLNKDWVVTYPKLTKCIDATDQPKNSAANEACNAFETQFAPFKAYVDALPATDPDLNDPNNRVGELKARVGILSATYFKQFFPSIKSGGFNDPNM